MRPSVRPCGVNIFKILKLRDRWAEVNEVEAWHVHSMGRGTKLIGSGI